MSPDFSAINATSIVSVIGALFTVVLIVAVASLVLAGVCWAWGVTHDNYRLAARGKTGVLVALGGAVACGLVVAWMNWLISVGSGF